MKVRELREKIEGLPSEMEIYMASDPEGNSYDSLYDVDPDCIWDGETIYSTRWSADDACMDEEEWESMKRENKRCLVLSP